MDIIQGSAEWFAIRCGKATASKICDIVATTKGGWGASRKNYAAQLIAERLTGTPADSFSNPAMAWGTEKEPEARRAYSFREDVDVAEIGFVLHPSIQMSGASPDGLVGDDGLVEIKAPNTATHIDTLLSEAVPAKYITQMMWQMACTGRKWCDFVSFDPRLSEPMRLFVKRVYRDDAEIDRLEKLVSAFLTEVDVTLSALRGKYEGNTLGPAYDDGLTYGEAA
jgi:putative phage-type endonuclease